MFCSYLMLFKMYAVQSPSRQLRDSNGWQTRKTLANRRGFYHCARQQSLARRAYYLPD